MEKSIQQTADTVKDELNEKALLARIANRPVCMLCLEDVDPDEKNVIYDMDENSYLHKGCYKGEI